MSKHKVLSQLHHDGVLYAVDSTVELTAGQTKHLQERKVIGPEIVEVPPKDPDPPKVDDPKDPPKKTDGQKGQGKGNKR